MRTHHEFKGKGDSIPESEFSLSWFPVSSRRPPGVQLLCMTGVLFLA
jgi:hypothetical protein